MLYPKYNFIQQNLYYSLKKHFDLIFSLTSFSAAEYGSVLCDGIPLADFPQDLQEGRVFKLHLRNNDLHRFPDAKLQGTGNEIAS